MTPKKVARHERKIGKILDVVLKRAEQRDRARNRKRKSKRGVASDKTFYE